MKLARHIGVAVVTAAVLAAVLGTCTKKREAPKWKNPLDPDGDNFHPPSVLVADDTVAINDTVSLTAVGTDANDTVTAYYWAIAGSAFACSTTVGVKDTFFPDSGYYLVRVRVADTTRLFSEPDSMIVWVKLYQPLVEMMADTSTPLNDSLLVIAAGSDTNGIIGRYIWALDGVSYADTTTAGSLWAVWADTGLKTVLVTVMDDDGLVSPPDQLSVTVKTYPPSVTAMNDTIVPIDETSTFSAQGADSNPGGTGSVVRYIWALDGTSYADTTTAGQVSTSYAAVGAKTVLVKVVDDDGVVSDPDQFIVTVKYKKPVNVYPADGDTVRQADAILRWSPQLFTTRFALMMDENDPPVTVVDSTLTDTFYDVSALVQTGRTYHWQVVAYNEVNQQAAGDVDGFVVNNIPVAAFSYAPVTGLISDTFAFDATASSDVEDAAGDLQVRWDFDNDGTWEVDWTTDRTAAHAYTRPGTKSVKLEVRDTDGLVGDTVRQLTVINQPPAAAFTVSPDTGQDITTVFSVDASGCTDLEDPAESLAVRWDWDGDGSYETDWNQAKTDSHTYTSPGTVTVAMAVRDVDDSVRTATRQIIILNTPPAAAFTVSPDSDDVSGYFSVDASGCTDLEDAATALEVRWDWDNDGSYETGWSTAKTDSHSYDSTGTKTIRLQVRDGNGFTDTLTKQVTVYNTAPQAVIGITPTRGDVAIWFQLDATGSSDLENKTADLEVRWDTDNDGSWEFGWSTVQTCSTRYTYNGTYVLVLEVRDMEGLTDRDTFLVDIANRPPTAVFTVSPASAPDASTWFSVDASGCYDLEDSLEVLQVRWDWKNDGTWDTPFDTVKTDSHRYVKPGVKTIAMQVTDTSDSVRTTTRQVSIANLPPTASFTAGPSPADSIGVAISVDASGCSDPEDTLHELEVRWDWENDGTWDTPWSATKTANHTYGTPGTKTIALQVRDLNDSLDTATRQVVINNIPPAASFTVTPDSGTVATGFIVDAAGCTDLEDPTDSLQVRWDTDNDGSWETGWTNAKQDTFTYATVGAKTIVLQVRDVNDSTATDTAHVTVYNTGPAAVISTDPGSGDLTTVFSFDGSGCSDLESAAGLLEVRWDFENDGSWDVDWTTTKTATHQYAAAGLVTLHLQVRDPEGLTDSTTRTLVVAPSAAPDGMTYIPGGTFDMGQSDGGTDEIPVHSVTVSAYWIDTTEVTQTDFQTLMGVNPALNKTGTRPVEYCTWYDAALYCNARSLRDGLDTVYSYTAITGTAGNGAELTGTVIDYARNGYRLPTETEWEFACRAMTTTDYFWSADGSGATAYAYYRVNSGGSTKPVAGLLPNDFNLYDIAGNVYEWVADWYSTTYYSESPATDPTGPATGTSICIRGGSKGGDLEYMRSAARIFTVARNGRYPDLGFRVVRPIP